MCSKVTTFLNICVMRYSDLNYRILDCKNHYNPFCLFPIPLQSCHWESILYKNSFLSNFARTASNVCLFHRAHKCAVFGKCKKCVFNGKESIEAGKWSHINRNMKHVTFIGSWYIRISGCNGLYDHLKLINLSFFCCWTLKCCCSQLSFT